MTVTKHFYEESFRGTAIPDEDFDRLIRRSTDILRGVCFGRTLPETDTVRNAICAQAEYLQNHGGATAYTEPIPTKETVGSYSVTRGKVPFTYGGVPVSPLALMILTGEGLRCCTL